MSSTHASKQQILNAVFTVVELPNIAPYCFDNSTQQVVFSKASVCPAYYDLLVAAPAMYIELDNIAHIISRLSDEMLTKGVDVLPEYEYIIQSVIDLQTIVEKGIVESAARRFREDKLK